MAGQVAGDAAGLRRELRELVRVAGQIEDKDTADAVLSWRSEVDVLSAHRLATQLRGLLPLQLEGVALPVAVQWAVDRLWPYVERVAGYSETEPSAVRSDSSR